MTSSRPPIVGPDAGPESPYPIRMEGPIISGFGRGSKELGIPTANLPVDEQATPWIADCVSGIYFGWAVVEGQGGSKAEAEKAAEQGSSAALTDPAPHGLYPMVMSIGYNPFYQNKARTAEVHILHEFARDFYGAHLRLALLGFVRPERGDYASLDALVEDIRFDCAVARRSLARPGWTPAGEPVSLALAGAPGEAGADTGVVVDADAKGTLSIPWLRGG